jgi:hypothetical protein
MANYNYLGIAVIHLNWIYEEIERRLNPGHAWYPGLSLWIILQRSYLDYIASHEKIID